MKPMHFARLGVTAMGAAIILAFGSQTGPALAGGGTTAVSGNNLEVGRMVRCRASMSLQPLANNAGVKKTETLQCEDGTGGPLQDNVVPAGKLLVVTDVMATFTADQGGTAWLNFEAIGGNRPLNSNNTLLFLARPGTTNAFHFQTPYMVLLPGSSLQVIVSGKPDVQTPSTMVVHVSGLLVISTNWPLSGSLQ